MEWEVGSFPTWTWPNVGDPRISSNKVTADRVWLVGEHVYDCAHTDPAVPFIKPYGILEGTSTELHPPVGIATMRGLNDGLYQ